jgi:enamine deaminase RidA (YjgF/YER057c/UK114 family)
MNNIDQKLKSLAIDIPSLGKPVASYVPYIRSGNTLYVSGQLPVENGKVKFVGTLGRNIDVPTGQQAARQCAINLLSCLKDACGGDLTRLSRVLHLQVLVASTPEFNEQHVVANGASDIFAQIFGIEIGSHTRAAYGIASIPRGACVEIAGTFELK